MPSPVQPMPRALRVARGSTGAVAATLLAALSHSMAGGDLTGLAILATTVVALPLCTALAGKVGSLWRLTIAVAAAQFLYHWSFAGLGASAGTVGTPDLGSAHSGHHLAVAAFAPNLGADTTMWALHAVAAIITIGLLSRGERAGLALVGLLRRALPLPPVALQIIIPRPTRLSAGAAEIAQFGERLFSPAAITHRGPPTLG